MPAKGQGKPVSGSDCGILGAHTTSVWEDTGENKVNTFNLDTPQPSCIPCSGDMELLP